MKTTPIRIYHNARCSKSRSACTLLEEKGVTAEVVDYLQTPPTCEELQKLLRMLGMKAGESLAARRGRVPGKIFGSRTQR